MFRSEVQARMYTKVEIAAERQKAFRVLAGAQQEESPARRGEIKRNGDARGADEEDSYSTRFRTPLP